VLIRKNNPVPLAATDQIALILLDLSGLFNRIKSMFDIDKQIAHWRSGAEEDWQVACELIEQGRIRHGMFFAHLALEKILRAHVCMATRELAPPTHNLVRLAQNGVPTLNSQQMDLLAEVNSFNIEGRYPELLLPLPTTAEAKDYLKRIGELVECLKTLF